ncbi:MAG: HEAT repeat domain-containing protein [Geodermatophilaceae bacterium]
MRPHQRVRQACARWGEAAVVRGCADLLRPGQVVEGQLLDLVMVLGELTDRDFLKTGKPPGHAYWARVWGARALLYAWTDEAAPTVVAALRDEQWRVREMAAKVVVVRELAEGADALADRLGDPVPRVRIAAAHALAAVGESEHGAALRTLRDDPEPRVAAAGLTALRVLSRRLDRVLD